MSEALRSVTMMIAEQLGEADAKPLDTIYSALEVLGVMRVQNLLAEAFAIEAQGGMTFGERRRTVGGVFFRHLKENVTRAELRKLRKRRMQLTSSRYTAPQTAAAA